MSASLAHRWLASAAILLCAMLWPAGWGVWDALPPPEQLALEEAERWHDAAAGYSRLADDEPSRAAAWHAEAQRCLWQHRQTQLAQSPPWHRLLSNLSLPQAAEQLAEILELVQNHAVEAPSAEEMFQHGLRDLALALDNASFRRSAFPAGLTLADRRALRAEIAQLQSLHHERSRSLVLQEAQRLASRWQLRHNASPAAILAVFWRAAAAVDGYSDYLPPYWYELECRTGPATRGSTGLALVQEADSLLVQQVLPGSPADRAGLFANDVITHLSAQPASTLRLEEAELMLLGPVGSKLSLHWQTGIPRQPRQAELVRVELPLASIVESHLADAEDGIGFIRLLHFDENTPKELDQALRQLGAARLQSLILDLRGNPGGLLTSAAAVAGRWLPPASVAFVTTGAGSSTEYLAKGQGDRMPKLVIMVDRHTASSAEALAAALSHHGRATLIGEATCGKSRVQHLLPLKRGQGGLRLSTCRWHLPGQPAADRASLKPAVPFPEMGRSQAPLSPEAEARGQFEAALALARSLSAHQSAP